MKGHGEKLSRKQSQLIAALLMSPTITEAAKLTGIGEVTVWRWLQNTEFQAQYQKAKRQAVAQAVARLQQASGEAVEALRSIMNDVEAPASARVSAAKSVLEMAVKGVEIEDIAARVEHLERLIEQKGVGGHAVG